MKAAGIKTTGNTIFVALMIFCSSTLYSQISLWETCRLKYSVQDTSLKTKNTIVESRFFPETSHSCAKQPVSLVKIPPAHPTAFFCRLEEKTAQSTRVPVIFRLGNAEQIHRIEGKRKIWE